MYIIGTIVSQRDFDAEQFTTSLAFVFVDELYPEREHLQVLPAGMYLSIASDDTNLERAYAISFMKRWNAKEYVLWEIIFVKC